MHLGCCSKMLLRRNGSSVAKQRGTLYTYTICEALHRVLLPPHILAHELRLFVLRVNELVWRPPLVNKGVHDFGGNRGRDTRTGGIRMVQVVNQGAPAGRARDK